MKSMAVSGAVEMVALEFSAIKKKKEIADGFFFPPQFWSNWHGHIKVADSFFRLNEWSTAPKLFIITLQRFEKFVNNINIGPRWNSKWRVFPSESDFSVLFVCTLSQKHKQCVESTCWFHHRKHLNVKTK